MTGVKQKLAPGSLSSLQSLPSAILPCSYENTQLEASYGTIRSGGTRIRRK
jgi:hypothetical protein